MKKIIFCLVFLMLMGYALSCRGDDCENQANTSPLKYQACDNPSGDRSDLPANDNKAAEVNPGDPACDNKNSPPDDINYGNQTVVPIYTGIPTGRLM